MICIFHELLAIFTILFLFFKSPTINAIFFCCGVLFVILVMILLHRERYAGLLEDAR